jgi:hypothetical protein
MEKDPQVEQPITETAEVQKPEVEVVRPNAASRHVNLLRILRAKRENDADILL